jgi:uncharacterized RDD family membrane protein YckC
MNCPNCGAEATESYCLKCGAQITKPGTVDEVSGKVLASWGLRVGATLIDFLILVIPEFVLRSVLGNAIGTSIYLVVFGVYLVSMWSLGGGRSVGNRVAKTQILDAASGGLITSQQAFRRYMFLELYAIVNLYGAVENVKIVALLAVVYGAVDVLFPLFDVRKQTLHDKFARTVVVVTDAPVA